MHAPNHLHRSGEILIFEPQGCLLKGNTHLIIIRFPSHLDRGSKRSKFNITELVVEAHPVHQGEGTAVVVLYNNGVFTEKIIC